MSYSSVVLADSPLAYYRLGEASGSVMADSSGSGRDGTYSSATLGVAGALVGDGDAAASFAGTTTSYGLAPEAAWMNQAQFTYAAWFKATATSYFVLTRWDAAATTRQQAALDLSSGKVRFYVNVAGATKIATSPLSYNDGTWHHVVGVYDGASVVLYVDGAQVSTVSAPGTGATFTGGDGLYVSARQTGTGRSGNGAGSVDEVAVYGTALPAARILAHYQAGQASLASVAGSVAATLPSLAGSLAGTYGPSGSMAATLPGLTADIEGGFAPPGTSGDLGATLPRLSGSLAGSYVLTGQLAATLPALTANLVARLPVEATLGVTLPSLTTSLAGANGNDFLAATLPSLTADIEAHAYSIVQVGTVRTNRANGIRLGGSAVTEVDAPLEDDPPNLTTVPIRIITPTVPAPTLVNGRPQ